MGPDEEVGQRGPTRPAPAPVHHEALPRQERGVPGDRFPAERRRERSLEGLEELTREAETLLERLGLHYRRLRLATGDLGQSGAMTYDLEVWAPGVGAWLEVSSCTTFTDYQARRANIRFRRAQSEKPEFVHTLNGSGLALPRVMAAVLETYQNEDGSVSLPEVLHSYVGMDRLGPPV